MSTESSPASKKSYAYITLVISIAFGISGQLLMKYTMSFPSERLGTASFLGMLILSLTIYSLGVLNWIITLKNIKLSVAYPLTSLNYVGILLGSYYFFNEEINLTRILGVILVFSGVLLVALPIKNRKIFRTRMS
jgi:multidrug transporter EmrE-like cation transporter